MAFYAGFDTRDYPGNELMNWLKANSNLKWCGYYLEPAPNRSPSGWKNTYSSLKDNWGTAPIYVGQQDGQTAKPGYNPSSALTASQGWIDGQNAADLANGDGFPHGTFIYLDWEYGAIDGVGAVDYITAWVKSVTAGPYRPALYCSHAISGVLRTLLENINPTPFTRSWYWKVTSVNPHRFGGDLKAVPELDPSGCGVPDADAWQREQNAEVTFPANSPAKFALLMDFSTSAAPDPGAPLPVTSAVV